MKDTDKCKLHKNVDDILYSCIAAFFAIFFIIGVLFTESAWEWKNLIFSLEKQDYTLIFIWIYFLFGITCLFFRNKIYGCTKGELLFFLFILSFVPRFLVACQNNYIPSSDFKQYYEAGVYFAEGDWEFVKNFVKQYGIPKFGGLAVFMGIIAKLFSIRLLGFQVANAFITSLISIFIFLCVEARNKKVAIIAGVLFAIYPSNIISSQITTNHHGAVLFTLIGIFCLLKSVQNYKIKKVFLILVSGMAFAVSDFIHPSVIVPIIAVGCYGIMGGGGVKNKLIEWGRLKCCIYVIMCYFIALYLGFFMLKEENILKSIDLKLPYGKVIVGLNYDTRGTFSMEDYSATAGMSKEQKRQWFVKELEERIWKQSPRDIALLLRDKMDIVWFKQDSYFWWYWGEWYNSIEAGRNNGTLQDELYWKEMNQIYICTSYARFDWIFVRIIYVLAVFGAIACLIEHKHDDVFKLISWVLLGWMLVHMIIEVQERYRYLGIPYVFILAALGIEFIVKMFINFKVFVNNKI